MRGESSPLADRYDNFDLKSIFGTNNESTLYGARTLIYTEQLCVI